MKRKVAIFLFLLVFLSLGSFQAYAVDNWITLSPKFNVPLNKVWTVAFSQDVTKSQIDGIIVEKGDEYVPVSVTLTGDNTAKVTPVHEYSGNSQYHMKVFLSNGKRYLMDFTTVSTPRDADKEPNNSWSTANDLYLNETVKGSATNDGDYFTDWYKIQVNQDGKLTLNLKELKGNAIYLYLYGTDGDSKSVLATDTSGSSPTRKIEEGLSSGTYYIKVAGSSSTQSYELTNTFTANNTPGDKDGNDKYLDGGNLPLNSKTTGHITYHSDSNTYDSTDWYKVQINQDGLLSLGVKSLEGNSINLSLYGADGNYKSALATDYSNSSPARKIQEALSPGTYYVQVNSSYFGSYELTNTFIPNNTPNDKDGNDKYMDAGDLPLNSKTTGHITYRSDTNTYDSIDWYKVQVKQNGLLSLSLKSPEGNIINLSLFGEDGNYKSALATDNSSSGPTRKVEMELTPGTYYVQVNSGNFGSYELANIFTPGN